MRDRDHVGELRPSQLMHTYEASARTVELPEADDTRARARRLAGARSANPCPNRVCFAAVQARRGRTGRAAADPSRSVPDGDSSGVPVAPFPRWAALRLPCSPPGRRSRAGVFKLKPEPWRAPSETRYGPATAAPRTKATRRPPTAIPRRLPLMACQDGHLDDFPWVRVSLHGGHQLQRHAERLIELGSAGRPGDVQSAVRRKRTPPPPLTKRFGEDAAPYLPPRLPWSPPTPSGPAMRANWRRSRCCSAPANTLVPVQSSALAIPVAGERARPSGSMRRGRYSAWAIIPPGSRRVSGYTLTTNPALKDLADAGGPARRRRGQ